MGHIDKRTRNAAAFWCTVMMIALGASDALRGVFLPVFKGTFGLSQTEASVIIMVSYIGNMVFLFLGGYISDRVDRRKFIIAVSFMWMAALCIYIFTENYLLIVCAMLFSMGASTMLSTTVNVITPIAFMSPALMINIFNFIQGIGIVGAQKIGGQFTDSIGYWHRANAILLVMGLVGSAALVFMKLPKPSAERSSSGYGTIVKNPACFRLILLFGTYCVAEHGLQNWLTTYGSEQLGYTVSQSADFLSYFFLGITVGRLVFAPIAAKIGAKKTLLVFSLTAGAAYIIGVLAGRSGIFLLCLSGLGFSVLWPTMVLLISKCYPPEQVGTATGLVIGSATLFDIAFNALFGRFTESVGLANSILILPAAMLIYCIVYLELHKYLKKVGE